VTTASLIRGVIAGAFVAIVLAMIFSWALAAQSGDRRGDPRLIARRRQRRLAFAASAAAGLATLLLTGVLALTARASPKPRSAPPSQAGVPASAFDVSSAPVANAPAASSGSFQAPAQAPTAAPASGGGFTTVSGGS
jgi:hypothetical protein